MILKSFFLLIIIIFKIKSGKTKLIAIGKVEIDLPENLHCKLWGNLFLDMLFNDIFFIKLFKC